ncbi:MAG: hypothetical protein KDB03_01780 [Planctomycetales bacterium]|nr:hypothetical protein [Planctomycetales bacterium]
MRWHIESKRFRTASSSKGLSIQSKATDDQAKIGFRISELIAGMMDHLRYL